MREFGMILGGGLLSAVLGAGFGWLIGHYAPEFISILARPIEIKSPEAVGTAMGAINGLLIGAAAMSIGILAAVFRGRSASRVE